MRRIPAVLLLLLATPALAADFSGCQPYSGLNPLRFFKYGPQGESVVQQSHPDLQGYDASDSFGERLEYTVIDLMKKQPSRFRRERYVPEKSHRETLYITRQGGRPSHMTYVQDDPSGHGKIIMQEQLAYTGSGRCTTRRSVSWRQDGDQISDVHVGYDRAVCKDVSSQQRDEVGDAWLKPGWTPPPQSRRDQWNQEFLERLKPLLEKRFKQMEKVTILAPGIGEREVEARISNGSSQ